VPETSWDKIDHRAQFERAEINRTGPGWSDTSRTERLDHTLNLPFEPVPPVERLPPGVRPSDAELRQQLQIALDAQKIADDNLQRAGAVHERAEHHLQKCQRRFAEFATLDDEIAETTLEALRCDAGRLSPDLSEEMERRLIERERARTEMAAADHAAKVLLAERAEASASAGDAAKATGRVVCAVLSSTAQGIAVSFYAAMQEAERCVRSLAAFDMYAGIQGGVLPGLVRGVLLSEPRDMRVPASALGNMSLDAWRRAGDALRADPHAALISMDDLLPPPPPRPPMMVTFATTAPNPAHARFLGPARGACVRS
jgi:hypothetical protein